MKIIVLKFGGTSVGTTDRIKKVAKIIAKYKKKYNVIVLSSAMSGVTNNLINLSKKISKNFSDSEYDVLVSSGEQMSCALISGELINQGFNSRSWISWQIPINTEGKYKFSRINKINKGKILSYIKKGGIPIVTGFQGINNKNRITTIGRGGTDASAIMFAKFFNAEKCIIYTDVDGIYSTDPNKLKSAKKIKIISYEEMLEMASLGAKVMQPHSIQDARLNRVDIEVRSSFTDNKGTLITKRKNIINSKIITGISNTTNDAKVTLLGVKDKPGIAASETDLTFTIKSDDLSKTKKIILQNKKINFRDLIFDKNVSKVSIIGVGMVTTPGVTYRMFQSLAEQKINIQVISTSEIKISVLINKKNVKKAISALHKEFKLNK